MIDSVVFSDVIHNKVAEKSGDARDYDYLLSMKIWSLTMEQVQKLRNEQTEARQELETVRGTSVQEMWRADLTLLEEVLEEVKKKRKKATSIYLSVYAALVSHKERSSHPILQISIVPDEEVKKPKKNNRAQTASKPKTETVKKEAAPKKKPEQKKITSMLPKSSDVFDMALDDIDSDQLAKVFFSSHRHSMFCNVCGQK
jgi:DNA topoisomerase-2